MGILDDIGAKTRDALTPAPIKKITDVLGQASKQVESTMPAATPRITETTTPQQKAYEAKEAFMNRNNPGYVPRAKGGRVRAGGAKNVDNSGLTKEPC